MIHSSIIGCGKKKNLPKSFGLTVILDLDSIDVLELPYDNIIHIHDLIFKIINRLREKYTQKKR